MTENCDYYGDLYYNGQTWHSKFDCQQCACSYGRVVCSNIECESTFCLKNEILVRKKDNCCLECRPLGTCTINSTYSIIENEFWTDETNLQKTVPSSCRICKCLSNGQLECFTKSCQAQKYPTFVNLKLNFGERKELSAKTIPFLADFIKSFDRKSYFFIISPKNDDSNECRIMVDKRAEDFKFTLNDLIYSRVFYSCENSSSKNESNSEDVNSSDINLTQKFLILTFISYDSKNVHRIMIQFELNTSGLILNSSENQIREILNFQQRKSPDRNIRDFHRKTAKNKNENLINKLQPRKTIFIQPGEAIKLTSNELKPKSLPQNASPDRLIYFLVSGQPKFGDLKLKKLFNEEEISPGWNKVNDMYLEKPVKEFTQSDLDNGNVWYEPHNDFFVQQSNTNLFTSTTKCKPSSLSDDEEEYNLIDEQNSKENCREDLNRQQQQQSSQNKNMYDHCMFEVYDQEKLSNLISKEIIHFSVQNEIINETVLGLEVIENQITPLAYSNFDIAGIDSNRDYLVYRIIKSLEKNQGQIEHAKKPGLPIETFTQSDLNKGLILYYSPKEIGTQSRDFFFTFVVTNDHRSDTFPETPFHIRVIPANDQAPAFKSSVSNIEIQQGGSLILPRELFDVEDPDTPIENLVFTIEKAPENLLIELRSKGQRYVINRADSFNIQEIRDGTFRLVDNSGGKSVEKDSFKLSASDNKHLTIKTVNINLKSSDKVAPQAWNRTSLLLNIKEGQVKNLRREMLAFVDDRSSAEEIIFKIIRLNSSTSISGKFFKKNELLTESMTFTQADIDLQNIRYEAPKELGPQMLIDLILFDVSDKEGNVLTSQVFTIKIEPVDNQAPQVDILQPVSIPEGGYLLFNETLIQIRDADSFKEQLNVIIDAQPSFGHFENTHKGK
jgi:hypothetical protein